MLDFDRYHREVLVGRCVTELGRAAAADVCGVPAIAFRLPDGRAYRFVECHGIVDVAAGDDAGTVLDLEHSAWADFVGDLATGAGLLYGSRVRFARGTPADLERWEPALRALYNERPLLALERAVFRTQDGTPLDLRRRHVLSDPVQDLRHFLRETGYLHVGGVFTSEEIARLRAAVEQQAARARSGDGTSWWAMRRDGRTVLCRLIYLGLRVPAIAALSDDPRLRTLAGLAGEPLRAALDRSDGHSLVIKNAEIASGLSDLPWHRDCGLGGHPVTCPALNIGIQLDAATAASGRLHFLAGSWRGSVHRSALTRPDQPVVAIDTEPGDVTVHLGDVLHAAPPPEGMGLGRRALYVSFMPERAFGVIGPGQSYNDVIRAREDGRDTTNRPVSET